eukprot:scaffold31102_cov110-Isochrysis_galbana.AAC.3
MASVLALYLGGGGTQPCADRGGGGMAASSCRRAGTISTSNQPAPWGAEAAYGARSKEKGRTKFGIGKEKAASHGSAWCQDARGGLRNERARLLDVAHIPTRLLQTRGAGADCWRAGRAVLGRDSHARWTTEPPAQRPALGAQAAAVPQTVWLKDGDAPVAVLRDDDVACVSPPDASGNRREEARPAQLARGVAKRTGVPR